MSGHSSWEVRSNPSLQSVRLTLSLLGWTGRTKGETEVVDPVTNLVLVEVLYDQFITLFTF